MSDMSNNYAPPLDFSEASILQLMEDFKKMCSGPIVVKPTRYVLPPWVVEEIEAQYGAPATQEKYHRWNMRRLNLAGLCPHGIDRDKVCEACYHERAVDE
jgi:hypothetical protein